MTIIKDIYSSLFGKDYESVWRQFSIENNGEYIVGKSHHQDGVEIIHLGHKIIFDRYIHYQVVGGKSYDTEFTRIRLEFKSPDNLRLRITNQGFIDNVGKLFGAQDIIIGDKKFDRKFMIKGNDDYKIQTLFSNDIIKNIIMSQSDIQLHILDSEGIFDEPIQEGNSMLYYISQTVVKEIGQLNSLLKLYKELIEQLKKLSSAKPIKASS